MHSREGYAAWDKQSKVGGGGPPAASVRQCALTAERQGPSRLVLQYVDFLYLLQGAWCIVTSVDLSLLP